MASTSETPQAVSLPNLPAAALKLVAQELCPKDKKSLALTSKAVIPIIRSLWKSIIIDLAGKEAPPSSLKEFRGVTKIIITDSALAPLDRSVEWECEYTLPGNTRKEYNESALSLISQVVAFIWGTKKNASGTTIQLGEMNLQIAIHSRQRASNLLPILKHATPEWYTPVETDMVTSVVRALKKCSTDDANKDEPARGEYPFTDVDAGWFYPDGSLMDVITKGSVCWTPTLPLGTFELEYYDKIHSLRLCVPQGSAAQITADFPRLAAPKINSLHQLRELHLGCPPSEFRERTWFTMNGKDLQLPGLTKLDLNQKVYLTSFKSLTHLSSLQEICITMPDFNELGIGKRPHPQDLGALAVLENLRFLLIDDWEIEEEQDISVLSQPSLTKLHFSRVHGRVGLLEPKRPMPNLIELGFLRTFYGMKRWRFIMQDCHVAKWCLGKTGAANFPNITGLQLQLMGYEAGDEAKRDQGVTTDQIHEMIAHSPSLEYVIVNKVLINVPSMPVLMLRDEHFTAPMIKDEIELAGVGGVKHTWGRHLVWGNDCASQSMVIEYYYNRLE